MKTRGHVAPVDTTVSPFRSLQVLETFPPEMQVFMKDSSGQGKPYTIDPDDSIHDLKEKIEEAGGPYMEDQILRFRGQKLWNQ